MSGVDVSDGFTPEVCGVVGGCGVGVSGGVFIHHSRMGSLYPPVFHLFFSFIHFDPLLFQRAPESCLKSPTGISEVHGIGFGGIGGLGFSGFSAFDGAIPLKIAVMRRAWKNSSQVG